jgi:hypothetical protein
MVKIIALIVVSAVIAIATYLGVNAIQRSNAHNIEILRQEHSELAEMLHRIDTKCDGIKRIEDMIKAAMAAPYYNDMKQKGE